MRIPLITVLHTRVDKDGGGAVYHYMFNAVPREKRFAHSRSFSLYEQFSLPPEKGHRVKASFLRGGHRVGTHSRSGFPKWGVGPSLQAPLKPCRLLSGVGQGAPGMSAPGRQGSSTQFQNQFSSSNFVIIVPKDFYRECRGIQTSKTSC